MISDVLSELVTELDRYLNSEDWRGFYGDETSLLVRRLRRLRDEADDLRFGLDAEAGALAAASAVAELDPRYEVRAAVRFDL